MAGMSGHRECTRHVERAFGLFQSDLMARSTDAAQRMRNVLEPGLRRDCPRHLRSLVVAAHQHS